MFVVIVEFSLKAEHRTAFIEAMLANARVSLAEEPGCHHFDVNASPDDPNLIHLYELYDDRAAFDAHLQSPHFLSFNRTVQEFVADKRVRFLHRLSGS
jgi:(4S)-4-hydroxy-5-phosphonooxypentane-2,3-dione isomerase